MLLRLILSIFILLLFYLNAQDKIGMYEKQGTKIPLNLEFINEYNQKSTLKNTINNKPTIFTCNYF